MDIVRAIIRVRCIVKVAEKNSHHNPNFGRVLSVPIFCNYIEIIISGSDDHYSHIIILCSCLAASFNRYAKASSFVKTFCGLFRGESKNGQQQYQHQTWCIDSSSGGGVCLRYK